MTDAATVPPGGPVQSESADLPEIVLRAAPVHAGPPPCMNVLQDLRVVVVTSHYRSGAGGRAAYAADIADYLAARGARVLVLTGSVDADPKEAGAVGDGDGREGPEVVQLPRRPSPGGATVRRAMYQLAFASCAFRHAVTFRPDAVLGCVPGVVAGAIGTGVAHHCHVPSITVVQALVEPGLPGSRGPRRAVVDRLRLPLQRWALRHSAAVAVPSPVFEPLVGEVAPSTQVCVVPVGSNRSRPHQTATRDGVVEAAAVETLRAVMGWHGRFVILHVGPAVPMRRLEELALGLHHLAVARPETLICFDAEGRRREVLERLTAGLPNVQLRDRLDRSDQGLLLLAADAVLVHEGGMGHNARLPEGLLDYLSAGRPVLAMARPGSVTAVEITRSGAGLVVADGDPRALATAVARLGADPAAAARMGAAGVAYAKRALQSGDPLDRLARLLSRSLRPTGEPDRGDATVEGTCA
jgi:colanic acid biosynthesis glycosyl transferase WcaI